MIGGENRSRLFRKFDIINSAIQTICKAEPKLSGVWTNLIDNAAISESWTKQRRRVAASVFNPLAPEFSFKF
jgi:hypothetical protein